MARLVMLEIGGLGFVRPVRPSPSKLRSDVCILVDDERSGVLWLWIGRGVRFDTRRTAIAKAEQIGLEGHRVGDMLVGGGGRRVIVIDQDKIEEEETARLYGQLVALLQEPMEIRSVSSRTGMMIYAEVAGAAASAPTAAPAVEQKMAVSPPSGEVKASTRFGLEATLMAILRVHPETYIRFREAKGVEELIVETADGYTHMLRRRGSQLSFQWDPKTPPEIKRRVAEALKRFAG